jgi:hypothetical protein
MVTMGQMELRGISQVCYKFVADFLAQASVARLFG